jgi:hypothetical protein
MESAMDKEYTQLDFKMPVESSDYLSCSDFVVSQIESIIKDSIQADKNKIIINTNLKRGVCGALPLKSNIFAIYCKNILCKLPKEPRNA